MPRLIRTLVAAVAMVSFLACSLVGPRTQSLLISSEPLGANVTVNGEVVGQTPTRVEVSRGEDALIEVRHEGYETGIRTTSRTLSAFGIVDTVGGYLVLVPFVGLFSPAAWEHKSTSYGFILLAEGTTAAAIASQDADDADTHEDPTVDESPTDVAP